MQVEFDSVAHIYRVDGRRVPGVTEVLKENGLINDEWYTEASSERGRAIHLATEFDDDGDLDEETLDPGILGYVQAWRQFKFDTHPTVLQKETVVVDPFGRYAGTEDRTITFPSSRMEAVIDIKSGEPCFWHPIQTAAYARCHPKPVHRYAVYLRSNGTYRMAPHKDRSDEVIWEACLTLVLWKVKIGELKLREV